MSDDLFLDTNLWVYLHARSEPQKQAVVKKLIADHFDTILISTHRLSLLAIPGNHPAN